MKKLKFLLSLTTKDNDYQQEQATAAEDSARRLGVDLQIIYADNDSITQSQQLLTAIQSQSLRPDAIIFEPVGGTALPQVARAAATAGSAETCRGPETRFPETAHETTAAPPNGAPHGW